MERAKVVHRGCFAASSKLRPLRGHRSVAEGRARSRRLSGRAARLPHLLFLEEKPEVRTRLLLKSYSQKNTAVTTNCSVFLFYLVRF